MAFTDSKHLNRVEPSSPTTPKSWLIGAGTLVLLLADAVAESHSIALFPSASDPVRQGFARVINHAAHGGEIRIVAVDDAGNRKEPITLSVDARQTAHFNSDDLERGNAGKGLSGAVGSGKGDWRLELTSDLDIEVLAYVRTSDGFLTAMHDVAPVGPDGHYVSIFNPGSNPDQVKPPAPRQSRRRCRDGHHPRFRQRRQHIA